MNNFFYIKEEINEYDVPNKQTGKQMKIIKLLDGRKIKNLRFKVLRKNRNIETIEVEKIIEELGR